MAKNKKYSINTELEGSTWKAQIIRQITSKKTHTSKEQDGFTSEEEAKIWAEQQITEFSKTQGKSNQRHAEQRKQIEEQRRQRSQRRAEKTLKAKQMESQELEQSLIAEDAEED